MDNLSIGTQPKDATPVTPADTSQAISLANNANFKGHKLQPTQSFLRVEGALHGECSICRNGYTKTDIKQLSLLPCFHLYHSTCLTEALDRQRSCPECRAIARPSTIKVYEDSTTLREGLPLACTEKLCTAVGDKASISVGTKAVCPYPLATFPCQDKAENFLENNHIPIIEWLRESFAQKQYRTADVRYFEKFCGRVDFEYLYYMHQKPAITLDVRFNPNEPMRALCYSSVDINEAKTPEAAFTNLLEDIRTDLLFLNLRNTHPAMFDLNTDLHIYHYDLWTNNAIFINDLDNSVPLRTIFDPSTKSFSWDRLKQELEKKGFEYKKLFETTPSKKFSKGKQFSQNWQVDSVGASHFSSGKSTVDAECITPSAQHLVSKSTLEIPSGEFDTNSFLF